jgi:hypothetical protein
MLWRRQIGQYIGEVNLPASSKRVAEVALECEVRKEFCPVHFHQMFSYEWAAVFLTEVPVNFSYVLSYQQRR